MKTRLFVGFAALLACAALYRWVMVATEQSRQAARKTYLIQLKPFVGEESTLQTTTFTRTEIKGDLGSVSLPGDEGTITVSTRKSKTVAVKPDGTIVQRVEHMGSKHMTLGEVTSFPKSPPTTQETDKYGRTKSESLIGRDSDTSMKLIYNFAIMFFPAGDVALFPDHPVRLGESWTSEFRPGNGTVDKIISTLISAEISNGKSVLKMRQTRKSAIDTNLGANGVPAKAAGDALMWMKGDKSLELVITVLEESGRILSISGSHSADVTVTLGPNAGELARYGNKVNIKLLVKTSGVSL